MFVMRKNESEVMIIGGQDKNWKISKDVCTFNLASGEFSETFLDLDRGVQDSIAYQVQGTTYIFKGKQVKAYDEEVKLKERRSTPIAITNSNCVSALI